MMSSIRVIEFKTEYDGSKPVDWVLVAPNGAAFDKCRTWQRISRIQPPEGLSDDKRNADTYVAMKARWDVIEPHYTAWKQGLEVPETGTPLAAWAGVSADQARHLRSLGFKTVEDVAEMPENTISRLPFPNARKLPDVAREYLDGATASEKDRQIAEMKERMAALEEALTERIENQPKKRGRPPKAESVAA